MEWTIKKFNDLTLDELYEICKVRYEVFACEQKIHKENDLDYIDKESFHLFLQNKNEIVAYARLIPKGLLYNEASIGRVLVVNEYRRQGIASKLVKKAVECIKKEFKEEHIVLSSQLYAKDLYKRHGFKVISDIYNQVDIPHVKMKLF
ncbi:GNAT family N-acetyltransferase [Clostridium taeniosporum]|uniref:GNAT family N-acetyltransferase n=1 Tax=Clostridium taeniosporum TaxID=394958 RepID=A0A1D7XFX8_9CLOT|nr:GNAT family N-acetyltransferase [Clostridium taeniosporum]AOR22257.1 GNAT family N-acetyltransferase [Clostridium taeniosporum]